ncbi:MAG: glycosyltransferase family 4 protein, partial [Candidatus Vecturithrix sp.]|nr:glycosyltransferase family 4 protein [Candidatus Vecturithrix sp.]
LHYEGSFRGNTLSGAQNIQEEIYFRKTWNRNVDPYYNINHSLQNEDTFKHATAKNTRLALFDLTRRPIKILSVSHNLNFEGAPLIKFSVDQYLHHQNHITLHVLCLKVKNGPLGEYYSQAQIPIDIIDVTWNSNSGGYQRFQHEIRQYLRQGGFDLVYTNTLETFWAIEAAHAEGIPSVWNILESIDYYQYFDEYQMDPRIRAIAKQTFVKANRHIFGSQATARLFQQYDHYGAGQIIYNNIHTREIETLRQVDKHRLKQELHVPSDKKIVSIIGTVCPRKGQLDFAKAAADILRRRDDVCFYIVGVRHEAYLQPYLAQIHKVCAQQSRIVLIDETPEALKYFRLSDIFVCASYNESFPIVTLEAMGFSLPIVTTPMFGVVEQIVDGKTGLFFEPGDIAAMQQHIEKLLDNPQLAKNLGMNARSVVTTNFSEQEMLEKYCRLMEIVACEDVNQVEG